MRRRSSPRARIPRLLRGVYRWPTGACGPSPPAAATKSWRSMTRPSRSETRYAMPMECVSGPGAQRRPRASVRRRRYPPGASDACSWTRTPHSSAAAFRAPRDRRSCAACRWTLAWARRLRCRARGTWRPARTSRTVALGGRSGGDARRGGGPVLSRQCTGPGHQACRPLYAFRASARMTAARERTPWNRRTGSRRSRPCWAMEA
jgi:hypothetical protein